MEGPLQNLRQSLIQLPAPKTVRLLACKLTAVLHECPSLCMTCNWRPAAIFAVALSQQLMHHHSFHQVPSKYQA